MGYMHISKRRSACGPRSNRDIQWLALIAVDKCSWLEKMSAEKQPERPVVGPDRCQQCSWWERISGVVLEVQSPGFGSAALVESRRL